VKRALISDIHSNLEALEAVLADIKQQGIRQIYCLGDIIGYGPNPRECIDLVIPLDICLLGNHDQGALFDPEGFNTGAERAIFWTRDQLESSRGTPEDFPEDIYNQRKMEKIFSLIENHCFQGHTHVPGVFTQSLNFLSPEEIGYEYRLGDERTMVNVGSVGQPRDGDPRACYVVLDDGASDSAGEAGQLKPPCTVRFRRIEYPLDKTIQKIYDIPELDNFLGDRLREGR
jgi:predicted phosphodiesterase